MEEKGVGGLGRVMFRTREPRALLNNRRARLHGVILTGGGAGAAASPEATARRRGRAEWL